MGKSAAGGPISVQRRPGGRTKTASSRMGRILVRCGPNQSRISVRARPKPRSRKRSAQSWSTLGRLSIPSGSNRGRNRGRIGVKPGPKSGSNRGRNRGQIGVKSGSNRGQIGVESPSTRGQIAAGGPSVGAALVLDVEQAEGEAEDAAHDERARHHAVHLQDWNWSNAVVKRRSHTAVKRWSEQEKPQYTCGGGLYGSNTDAARSEGGQTRRAQPLSNRSPPILKLAI
jgi:hypothetical protein